MTSSGQRSTRNHAQSISNEAALVGALAAFSKSPSTSPTAPRTSQSIRGIGRRAVSTGNYAARSFSQSSIQNGFADTVRLSARGPPPQEKTSDLSNLNQSSKSGSKPVMLVTPRAEESPTTTKQSLKGAPAKEKKELKDGDGLDETRIPSTSSLVKMFEKKETNPEPARPTIEIHSPRPRSTSRLLPMSDVARQTKPDSDLSSAVVKPIPERKIDPLSSPESFVSATDSLAPDMIAQAADLAQKPNLPPPRRRNFDRPVSPRANVAAESTESLALHSVPIRGSGQDGPYSNQWAASSSQSITAQYHQLHPRRMSALRTGESLANALVASSLASSRAPSPIRPPPMPHRNSRQSSFHSHHLFKSRTPSPAKKPRMLKQTLRKEDSSSSGSDSDGDPYGKHKKKRHIRKHPNKHNEGDRKRWRNAVTERERKRYEGVWAANRGVACVYIAEEEPKLAASYTENDENIAAGVRDGVADQVSDVVVRDLWQRSRLPQHVLQEIWDLVDGSATRRLSREEFVVGLWLIDQRLKGRKLPVRVSESVWNSVKLVHGIKIRKA